MALMDSFRRISRSAMRARNNRGIIELDVQAKVKKCRSEDLDRMDAYFDNAQYDNLPAWDQSTDPYGEYIPVRRRAPRFRVAFAKNLSQRVAAKLLGDERFPNFLIPESPDDQEFIRAVIRESKLKSRIMEPLRRCLNSGSVFVRFYLSGGAIRIEWYAAKYCYPTFNATGELASIEIKYVYQDKNDTDQNGSPKNKWFRMVLDTQSEVLFDNPEFQAGVEPTFSEVQRMDHGLGFVQGEWFRTCEKSDSPDGYGLTEDIYEFIDELNYSLSQSSQAVSYNQDPQLAINGMNEEEMTTLIRSAAKSWNLGRDGKAQFLETDLKGVERAIELRDKVRLNIADISRVVLLDPEKIVGSAQSGKAMEVLHGPMVDLVMELRGPIGDSLKNMVLKMALLVLIANQRGMPVPVSIPEGYVPQSFSAEISWNPVFQQTMEDLQKKVQVAAAASSANLVSRATLTSWLAKDFGITDVEAEIAQIAAQPVLNPFGGF